MKKTIEGKDGIGLSLQTKKTQKKKKKRVWRDPAFTGASRLIEEKKTKERRQKKQSGRPLFREKKQILPPSPWNMGIGKNPVKNEKGDTKGTLQHRESKGYLHKKKIYQGLHPWFPTEKQKL